MPTTCRKTLRQAAHKAIAAVTEDLAQLRFNRAVAQLYMLSNAIADAPRGRCRRRGARRWRRWCCWRRR